MQRRAKVEAGLRKRHVYWTSNKRNSVSINHTLRHRAYDEIDFTMFEHIKAPSNIVFFDDKLYARIAFLQSVEKCRGKRSGYAIRNSHFNPLATLRRTLIAYSEHITIVL